jgi:hypothetical protein
VNIDNSLGLIDLNGKMVIPIEIDEIIDTHPTYLTLIKDNKMAYFSKKTLTFIWKERGF